MPSKRHPLPQRFSVALSDKAYQRLRALNETYGYGNNYLLTIILENFDVITDSDAVEEVFDDFRAEFGAPSIGNMK